MKDSEREHMNSRPVYNNDFLVALVADDEHYLEMKRPRDERVLEAMRRVDRANFLDDDLMMTYFLDTHALTAMRENWRKLVAVQSRKGIVAAGEETNPAVLAARAVQTIPPLLDSVRELIVPVKAAAYNCSVLPIGYGQTCSEPSCIAFMDDMLDLRDGQNVLEIGVGSGYHAAITAELVGGSGKVTSVEIQPGFVEKARRRLERHFGGSQVEVVEGDGYQGFQPNAPYDRIYVTASVQESVQPLIDQLNKEDGRLLYPDRQEFHLVIYRNGKTSTETFPGVVFVPMKKEPAPEIL